MSQPRVVAANMKAQPRCAGALWRPLTHRSMVPNNQWGSLVKGISMPWNRAIFVAMAADNTGSRRSCVFSGRLCTQESLRVVRGLGQEGGGMGQWGVRVESGSGVRVVRADIGKGTGAGEGGASYWDVLFQPALWKDSVELGSQRPLRKDGEHHTFKDQRVHALKGDAQQGAGVARRTEGLRSAPSTAGPRSVARRLQSAGVSG